MRRKNFRVSTIIVMTLALGGCQLFGPNSIGVGRDRYNSIIQSTSMEQMMSNIVRVYQHEPIMVMDVTEVDATLAFGGSLTGATTNIGAKAGTTGGTLAGRTGSAGGTLQYAETPTIRYQPLLGQALVAQLVTPVSVDALGLLYDSSWPLASILDFASAYMTPDVSEFYLALDTILELDHRDALQMAAAKTGLPEPPQLAAESKSSRPGANPKPSADSNDSLFIYLRPPQANKANNRNDLWAKQRVVQLWIRLLRFYAGTQPPFHPVLSSASLCAQIGLSMTQARTSDELRTWDINIRTKSERDLADARDCLPESIELRVVPQPAIRALPNGGKKPEANAVKLVTSGPLMRTYSALGIMKNAIERPHPKIELVTPERYNEIRNSQTHPWNDDLDTLSYYTLLPEDEDSIDCPEQLKTKGCDDPPLGDKNSFASATQTITQWLRQHADYQKPTDPATDLYRGDLFVYEKPGEDVLDDEHIRYSRRLGFLRRYILIVVNNAPPPRSAYVAYNDGGRWYYISGDDPVSQKNFDLLSLFMTMMAVPPSTQPLSPVINVGG